MKGILTLEDVKKDNNFRNKFKSITLYGGECTLLNKEKIRVKEGKPKYKRDERNIEVDLPLLKLPLILLRFIQVKTSIIQNLEVGLKK